MAFGVYIHIPYCRQVCPYCDFTKYRIDKIMPPERYVESFLLEEIRLRAPDVPIKEMDTIYFGGGTPSLLEPGLILSVLRALEKAGFKTRPDAELTIEIDPATVDQNKLDTYLELGFNRFSVGAQTFNERLLKLAGRHHSTQDTVALLTLLKNRGVNYSFDLLFALPSQTLDDLRSDVSRALDFDPSHLSAYCLTVPEGHPMSRGRAPDEEQVEMFELIESSLKAGGLMRYEISNFAKPGFEARHNALYWTDATYWGIGTGAHSYFPSHSSPELKEAAPWGMRFWNSPSINLYEKEIDQTRSSESWHFLENLSQRNREILEKHQALTDFCHTSLRMLRGLDKNALRLRFGEITASHVTPVFNELIHKGWVQETSLGWTMSREGRLVANAVFEKLTFLKEDLKA